MAQQFPIHITLLSTALSSARFERTSITTLEDSSWTGRTELKTSETSVKAKPALREAIYAPYQRPPWFQPESDDSRPPRPARLDKFTRIPLRRDRRVAPLVVPVLADRELVTATRAVHWVDLVSGGNLDDVIGINPKPKHRVTKQQPYRNQITLAIGVAGIIYLSDWECDCWPSLNGIAM